MACFNALTAVRMLQLLTLFPFFWFSVVLNVFSVLDFLFGFGFGFLVFNETRVFFSVMSLWWSLWFFSQTSYCPISSPIIRQCTSIQFWKKLQKWGGPVFVVTQFYTMYIILVQPRISIIFLISCHIMFIELMIFFFTLVVLIGTEMCEVDKFSIRYINL